MGTLFRWFYCLSFGEIVMLVGAATIVYLWICGRYRSSGIMKAVNGGFLICWLGIIVFATLWQRSAYGSSTTIVLQPFHSYREIWNGGNIEIYRSNFMNVVLFYPAGLLAASLLPKKRPGWYRCVLVVTVLAAMSAGIEFLQYRFCLGRCEIDDVIHNTAGALLGCLAALVLPGLPTSLKEKVMPK